MKLILVLLTAVLFNLSAVETHAQNARINLNMTNSTVKEVLKGIENKSEFTFFYNDKEVDTNRKVSVSAENQSVSDILATILPNCNFRLRDKNIIITPKRADELAVNQQQKKNISGVVLDTNGEPVIGANVLVKGWVLGTVTDVDGKFALEVPDKAVLSVTYIGYIPQEIRVGNASKYDIVLKEDSKSLEEVVVIGYGTVKKSNLTGAITQIKSDDLPQTGNMSLGQMMTGKAAGMQVSLSSAQPGGGVWVQIRGNAAGGAGNKGPLYVIDGYPISTEAMEPESGNRYNAGSKSPLNNLNPADIASIEILKDASATAIYGARAANGVVLITTKRGKEGEKPKVQYSGSTPS